MAQSLGVRSFLIDGPDEIMDEYMHGVHVVAITGGASAPEAIIQSVVAKICTFGDASIEEVTVREEHFDFRVPQSLIALESMVSRRQNKP